MMCYVVIDTNVLVSSLLSKYDNAATVRVIDKLFSGEIIPDIKDLPFYEVVLEKQDENAYLVTGNIKHFPNKPFIVTPNELLEILEN